MGNRVKAFFRFLNVFIALLFFCSTVSFAEEVFWGLCREKMKKIYEATMEFVKDHDGYLPPAYMKPGIEKEIKGKGGWYGFLEEYLASMGEKTRGIYIKDKSQPDVTVYTCPANPYWYGGFGPWCLNYAWNYNLGVITQRRGETEILVQKKLVKFEDIADPAHTILLVDAGPMEEKPPYCYYHAHSKKYVGYPHEGKANILFLDGRIETLGPNEIDNSWFNVRRK